MTIAGLHFIDDFFINHELPLSDGSRLVVFDSRRPMRRGAAAIIGKEVFLFNINNVCIWQIDPEPGSTDSLHRDFNSKSITNERFVNVSAFDDRYFAARFSGDTFEINLYNGKSVYVGFSRT